MERPTFYYSLHRLWPHRLSNQVALLTIMLFTLGIMFFSVHVARENAQYTIRQIEQSGEALAKNISVTGSAYLFSTYYEPLEELLMQAANFPNVVELEVLDSEGRSIREVRRQANGEVKIFREAHRYKVPLQITRASIGKSEHNIVIWYPIISGILQGWVKVDMALDKLMQQQRDIYRNLLSLGAVILAIILATMLLFMRRPIQILTALTGFASRLDSKHGESIDIVNTSDELMNLGKALNKVSRELEQQDLGIQAALQALETQKTALDHHSIVSISDVRGVITYANDKFCSISEYSKDMLLGQSHRIIKSDKHSSEFFRDLWQTISHGQVWQGEICNKSKSGKEYWVDTTIVPFLDQQQRPYQYVAIRTEVTGLKILAKELADSRDRLEQSQAFANIGSWEWDIKHNDIFWSEQVPMMFGLTSDVRQVAFHNFLAMVHEQDRSLVSAALSDCLNHNVDYDIQHRVLWQDGSVRWLHERGNVARDEAGAPIRMLGVVQDITEQKETAKQMQALEEQMQQSQKMEAIGTMAGGIAHDFNNILTAIIGYAELNLLDMQEGSEAWENQHEILQASNRAKEVINQILLFSRKEPENEKIIRPGYVVKEAVRLLKTLLPKNIEFYCKSVDMQVAVRMSPTQLHQSIVNLCVNASHAIAENSKGVITVSLKTEEVKAELLAIGGIISAGVYAVLKVTDTGCGIESKHLPHIFEPFYTTKTVDKGTGMGLSVVYGIVNKACGAILVDSEPGEGSCFCLYLPVCEQLILGEAVEVPV